MALRISQLTNAAGTTLKVDGRLSGEDALELARVGAACGSPLVVDLSDLLHADDCGVVILRELQAKGADLKNVPPYVSLVLELEAHVATSARG